MLKDFEDLKKIANTSADSAPPAPAHMGQVGAPAGYSGGFGSLPQPVQIIARQKADHVLANTDPSDFNYKEKFSVEHEGKIYNLIAKSEGHFDNHPDTSRKPWWHRGVSIYVLSDPSMADKSDPISSSVSISPSAKLTPSQISSTVKKPEKVGKLTQIVVFYLKKKGKLKSVAFKSFDLNIVKLSETINDFEKIIKKYFSI